MRTVIVRDAMRIPLSKQGENNAVRVVWPEIAEKYAKLYGEGRFELVVVQRGQVYPAVVNVDGADLVWDVRAADTATAEVGSLELIYYVGDTIAKSQTWETVVVASASAAGTTEPPEDPARVWFDEIKRQIGDLGKLTTKAKENLVGAINEAAQTSSGGADWAQNDPSAKDYVKNRTHYVSRESRAVVPEQEVTTAVQNNFNIATLNDVDLDALNTLYDSDDDTTFDVVFDGVSYPCKWLEQGGNRIPGFGNLAIVHSSATDTGEPFCVTPGPKDTFVIGCKVAGTHTVVVSYQQDVVHRLDPKYIGEISGETLSVTGTGEFASDSWASDYSYFTDSWLTMNADSAKISIEINGKLVEDLPYSLGDYGAFTFGNVDTLGVAITNSGYGTSTQRVTVSTTVFPNGIKAARVFRKIAYRIPVDSLPEVISWIAKRTEDEFVLNNNRKFVNDNEATQVTDTIPFYNVFDVYAHKLMLLRCQAGQSFFDMSNTNRISIRHGTGGDIETVDVLMPDGTPVTADNWPKGATLLGIDRVRNVYLLNPRSNELILPSSTTDSTKKFRITVDDTGTISATEVSPP